MEIKVTAVIPAYNEAKTIRAITMAVLKYIPNVLVIDDGSTDETAAELRGLPVTIINHAVNQGKDASLIDGFKIALQKNIDGVLTLDADGQHDPAEIPNLLNAIKLYSNAIIIGARRLDRNNAPFSRKMANDLADFFISLVAGTKIIDSQSGYRFYPTSFIQKFLDKKNHQGSFVFESEILIDAARFNYRIIPVPIKTIYPKDRRASYFHPVKDTWRIFSMLVKRAFS